jgi:hypothetical protein
VTSSFARISEAEWRFSDALDRERRAWLQNSPRYEQLVNNILRDLSLVNCQRELSKGKRGYNRVMVTVQADAATLDQFYSSATGYRAQYYASATLGVEANRFALDIFLPRVVALIACLNKRTCPASFVEQSLRDQDAKLWLYQGTWLRYARKSDRNLLVARWLARQHDPIAIIRKRAKRSMLTPASETLLELKGGFLSATGEPLGTFKLDRAEHIHELGYT